MKTWFRISGPVLRIVLLGLLLVTLAVAPAPQYAQPLRVNPALLSQAAAEPDATLDIIVQTMGQPERVEEMIGRLGGTITHDLSIIHGFSALVPAKALEALAASEDVRWISGNAQVLRSTTTTFSSWATDVGPGTAASSAQDFNNTAIAAGRTIWFSLVGAANLPRGVTTATVYVKNAQVQFTSGTATYQLPMPGGALTYGSAITQATTLYAAATNQWQTRAPSSLGGNVYLTGLSFAVATPITPTVRNVTVSGYFSTDTPGLTASWKWGAAVYTSFNNTDYTTLGIKPVDSSTASQYRNSDKAGAPESYKAFLVAGARGYGGTNYTGGPDGGGYVTPATLFVNAPNIVDSADGPNSTFGSANNRLGAFTGIFGEAVPGNDIIRVEAVIQGYVPARVNRDASVKATVNGVAGRTASLSHNTLNQHVGAAYSGAMYVDVTSTRTWHWSDLSNPSLQLTVDLTGLSSSDWVYLDAVGLRVTSQPGSGTVDPGGSGAGCATCLLDIGALLTQYPLTVQATALWNRPSPPIRGRGVTIAVVDSGLLSASDVTSRTLANVNFNSSQHSSLDGYGHGTFVAGVAAGDGSASHGGFVGIAPEANIVNVRVTDDHGVGNEADVVAGLQWVLNNKITYNIRVVNLSLNTAVAESYHTSPLDAACEILWFNGIVVVVSAGNQGGGAIYPPANDPFVITVGATDDRSTITRQDDQMAAFSAYGTTESGFAKPDLVAPGTHLLVRLPRLANFSMTRDHPANRVGTTMFRLSGTSFSSPMVAGAVALMIQRNPTLNPDQIKYRLKATAVHDPAVWPGYHAAQAGAGMLDANAAAMTTATGMANTGTQASQLLWTGPNPITWESVSWNSVSWNSMDWSCVSWNSMTWSCVSWNSDYWGP